MDRETGRQLAQVAIALAGVAVILWMEAPAWQRQMAVRAVRARLRRAAARVARSSGHRAMGAELAGRHDEADQGYLVTYWLSTQRDRL